MEGMSDELVTSLVEGGKEWLVLTIAAGLPTLWSLTLIFHFARPYVIRVLRRLSLRFGADVWWLSYVLIRDAIMLITFALGTVLLLPGVFASMEIGLFAPIAALLLFIALVVKLFSDADDDPRAFRAVSLLLVAGATLYFVSLFFGVEAVDQEYLGDLPAFLVSATNPGWAGPILAIGLAGYALTGLYIFWRFTRALSRPLVEQTDQPEPARQAGQP